MPCSIGKHLFSTRKDPEKWNKAAQAAKDVIDLGIIDLYKEYHTESTVHFIVELTAKGQAQDRRMVEEIGAEGFMTKPFSNHEVVERVRELAAR